MASAATRVGLRPQRVYQPTGERGAGDHDRGREQKTDAGLQSLVAVHALEVEREEVQHRAEGRPEQQRDPDRGGEVAVGE
jgi:hypothetical protein